MNRKHAALSVRAKMHANFCASARHLMQAGAARKQACTFAGEQNVAGNIGALPRKLSQGCVKPLDEPQACSAVCASEDACNFCASARHLMQEFIYAYRERALDCQNESL